MRAARFPLLVPYRAQIECWLAEGVDGIAIHAALCREHGYRGSYSAVCRMLGHPCQFATGCHSLFRQLARRGAMVDRIVVHFSGLLASHSEALRRALLACDYAPMSATNLLGLAAHVSRWLEVQALGVEQFSAGHIAKFLAARREEYSSFFTERSLILLPPAREGTGVQARAPDQDWEPGMNPAATD